MPSLQDIANELGLAKTTVAGIMRHDPGFNDQTRQRVLKTAEVMGYRPNYLGRALAGGRSMSIGVLLGSVDAVLLARLRALEGAAAEAGYAAMVNFAPSHNTSFDPAAVEGLLERRVDGLVVHPLAPLEPAAIKLLERAPVPVVWLFRAPPKAKHRVVVDREVGLREAARHLCELSHRQVVYCSIGLDRAHPQERIEPFRRAFAEQAVELDAQERWRVPETADLFDMSHRAYDVVYREARRGELPTALFLGDDELAMAAIHALEDAGLSVPGDVSVLGHDDAPLASHTRPRLTTIREPGAELGAAGFDLLHRAMLNPDAEAETVTLTTQLVPRDSVGQARHSTSRKA